MKYDEHFRNKLYGGVIGKYIGVMHGAEIESWTYEQIKDVFGEIKQYPVRFNNFCSDDDLNGPLFYMRVLQDFGTSNISERQMGHTLLNYVGERHGFFWWGGYGTSTEETAYWNLLNGIEPPLSGSIEQNGKITAEQIGGQIFSDCWGLLCPGDPARAAHFAKMMSSVSHDGNGIYGGQFVVAAIASAFTSENVEQIIESALSVISADCEYALMVRDVVTQSKKNEGDFRKTFHFVKEKYGYQNYGGVCHIIPNAAVMVLSLIHGAGDFSDTLNICNMCGWDTDCNVGNIGTIMGVFTGAEKIPSQWTESLSDFLCASSVLGCLNIQTLSQQALQLMKLSHNLYGVEPEPYFAELFAKTEGKHFHFEFPGALHAIRVRASRNQKVLLTNTKEEAAGGERSLKVIAPYLHKGESVQVYFKSYYVPQDFQDSRYDPDFSPIVYPGDKITVMIKASNSSQQMTVCPFIRDRITGQYIKLEKAALHLSDPLQNTQNDKFQKLEFQIPTYEDILIEEIGWEFYAPIDNNMGPFTVFLDDVEIIQNPNYMIHFDKLPMERWNVLHTCVAGLTWLRGKVELEDGWLAVSGCSAPAEAYTGEIHWKNYRFQSIIRPGKGDTHRILFRVQGAMRCYAAGFMKDNRLVLWKKEKDYRVLCQCPFTWEPNKEYKLTVEVNGNKTVIYVNDHAYLEWEDKENAYNEGCIGFGTEGSSRTFFKEYEICMLE